jgi:hypothetical protein
MWGTGPYLFHKFLGGIYDDAGLSLPQKHVARARDEAMHAMEREPGDVLMHVPP